MSINHPKRDFQRIKYITGPSGVPLLYGYSYNGLELSENHHKLPDGSWSGGGPFYVRKATKVGELRHLHWIRNNLVWDGSASSPQLFTVVPSMPSIPTFNSFASTLSGYYATGYARARPGNPVASAGQFLVELRRLPFLPLLYFRRLEFFRSLGNEYLNVVFGWKPFVNDLKKMYNLYQNCDKQLAQIVRDNGRGVHRRSQIEKSSSTTQSSASSSTQSFLYNSNGPSSLAPSSGRFSSLTTTTTDTLEVWFSGKFRYFIPDISSSEWTARATKALYGLNPSPSLLWEVLPWSWLIDWWSNVGDVISNASDNAVDNLTCQYSFIMMGTESKIVRSAYTAWSGLHTTGALVNEIDAGSCTLNTTESVVTKLRQGGGNPFGLGVSFGSLSAYQVGILAALGLSRGLVK